MGWNTAGIWTTAPLKSLSKKSLLLIEKIVTLFPNGLTADGKHYLLNRDNLTQPINTELSQKQKTFPEFFFAFSISILNFEHFSEKDVPHSWCISEIKGSKKLRYINV